MKRIKPRRTYGTDWIDKSSLKLAGPLIEDSLLHLVNLSIREGSFSRRWKPQLIFPHHKKKERDILENYRPVSHLVQVGLIVEYAVYIQIVEHFIKYDLFHPNHHGQLSFKVKGHIQSVKKSNCQLIYFMLLLSLMTRIFTK